MGDMQTCVQVSTARVAWCKVVSTAGFFCCTIIIREYVANHSSVKYAFAALP